MPDIGANAGSCAADGPTFLGAVSPAAASGNETEARLAQAEAKAIAEGRTSSGDAGRNRSGNATQLQASQSTGGLTLGTTDCRATAAAGSVVASFMSFGSLQAYPNDTASSDAANETVSGNSTVLQSAIG